MYSRVAITLQLIFVSFFGISQEESNTDVVIPIAQYQMKVLTQNEGISSNNLTDVYQTSDGYIWASSYNGINSYDGYNFRLYDSKVVSLFKSNAVYSFFEDNHKNMWISTQGSGIIIYDISKKVFLPFESNTLPLSIRNTLVDSKGTIWAGSNNYGLWVKYTSQDDFIQYQFQNIENYTVRNIMESSLGEIWVTTEGAGIYKIDGDDVGHFTTADGISDNYGQRVVEVNGQIYVLTINGIDVYNDGSFVPIDFLKGKECNDMLVDNDGLIWIATEEGLARMDNSGNFEIFNEDDGFPSRQITSLQLDHEGNLWLSTAKSGLVQLRKTAFRNFAKFNGLSNNRVNIVHQVSDDHFLLGTDNGDIDQFKDGEISRLELETQLENISIKDIKSDLKGNLWIASYNGIVFIDTEGDEENITMEDGLPSNQTRVVLPDSKGNVWIGARSGGLVKIDPNRSISVIDKSHGLSSEYILSLFELPDGRILIGTRSGGLNILDGENLEVVNPNDSPDGLLVFNIDQDNLGTIWLSTNIGIFKYKDDDFTWISVKAGLPTETIFDLVLGEGDDVWITSNVGVIKCSKKELDDFAEGGVLSEIFLFAKNDGLITTECTAATRTILDSDGLLWIPTIEGLSVLNPSLLQGVDLQPEVIITALILDDTIHFGLPEKLRIPPGNLRYTFDYSALSYISPENIAFQYLLEPFNKSWQDVGNERKVEFTNLKPGNYKFQVRAENRNVDWSKEAKAMEFSVRPFFTQTIWFYLLIIVVITAIPIWRIYTVRQHNAELKKLNNELDSFVYSTSHDLRAPLMSVLGLVNIAKIDKDQNKVQEYLDNIEGSVKKLDSFISDIIDYSRNSRLEVTPVKVNLKENVNDVFNSLAYLDPENKIDKRIIIAENAENIVTDERRLNIVLGNILSNSFRYHRDYIENPFIEVEISQNTKGVALSIRDNGRGIKKEHQDKIFNMFYRASERSNGSGLGLYIVKETVEKLRGDIVVSSKWDTGTTFTIHIPSLESI